MRRHIEILRRHRHPVRFIAGRALVRTGLCRFLTIQQDGYRLRFYPSNLSETLWVDPTWRAADLSIFRDYLKPGDSVIDVGANIGDTALVSSGMVGPGGRIWAIEAHPRTYGFLTGNLALNSVSNVRALNVAVDEKDGELSFGDDRRDDMNRVGQGGLVVAARRLDDLVPPTGHFDFLKIDVEGYELPALRGAGETLAATDCVYFETGEAMCRPFGYTMRDLLGLFEQHGFSLLRISGDRAVSVIDASYSVTTVENLLAVKSVAAFTARTGWTAAP